MSNDRERLVLELNMHEPLDRMVSYVYRQVMRRDKNQVKYAIIAKVKLGPPNLMAAQRVVDETKDVEESQYGTLCAGFGQQPWEVYESAMRLECPPGRAPASPDFTGDAAQNAEAAASSAFRSQGGRVAGQPERSAGAWPLEGEGR